MNGACSAKFEVTARTPPNTVAVLYSCLELTDRRRDDILKAGLNCRCREWRASALIAACCFPAAATPVFPRYGANLLRPPQLLLELFRDALGIESETSKSNLVANFNSADVSLTIYIKFCQKGRS